MEQTKLLKVGWPLIDGVFYGIDHLMNHLKAINFEFTEHDDILPTLAAIQAYVERHSKTPRCLPEEFEQIFSEVLINAYKAQPEESKYVQLFVFPDGVLIGVDNKAVTEEVDISKIEAKLPEAKLINGQWVYEDHGRGLYLLTQSADSVILRQSGKDIEILIGYAKGTHDDKTNKT